jgi:signal transduction histidine kinase
MKLGLRISTCVFGVVVLALASSGLALYSAWETNRLMTGITTVNLPSVRAAEEVEIALLEQRVAIAAFLLDDGNRERLADLERSRTAFDHWSKRAASLSHSNEERELLALLMDVYRRYDHVRSAAVDVYDDGRPLEAKRLLDEMSQLYHEGFQLCERLIEANERSVRETTEQSDRRMSLMTWSVGIVTTVEIALAAVLLWLFFRGILQPLRSLLHEVHTQIPSADAGRRDEEEMHLVGVYLRRVLLDMQDAKTALDNSVKQLNLAERLASVGKLTASVAHEIRNPLTAMKLWLFSVRDSLGRSGHEDRLLQKIEDEIHRLETIVRHFLEFARPPEPRFKSTPIDGVLADSLELARPLLMEKDIRIVGPTESSLSASGDREQLIQVFSNLFYNAAQAMNPGGILTITATIDKVAGSTQNMIVIRIGDTGSGISPEDQERMFEPFFSTRPDGTGLGLCISASIIARHHGRLFLESTSSQGSTFVVQLSPHKESP